MKTINFKGYRCNIELLKYQTNNRTAIELIDVSGEPIATATINMPPEIDLKDDEVVIKNYSENEGILDVLISEGIVERTGKTVSHGYVSSEICRLLINN